MDLRSLFFKLAQWANPFFWRESRQRDRRRTHSLAKKIEVFFISLLTWFRDFGYFCFFAVQSRAANQLPLDTKS
jgi:hypothetical protein